MIPRKKAENLKLVRKKTPKPEPPKKVEQPQVVVQSSISEDLYPLLTAIHAMLQKEVPKTETKNIESELKQIRAALSVEQKEAKRPKSYNIVRDGYGKITKITPEY